MSERVRIDLGQMRGRARMEDRVLVREHELEALLAVVDAAWGLQEQTPEFEDALEPFTPPAVRAVEEVDRWNAEHGDRELWRRWTNGPPPPDRDAIRDQLADAGVAVQRQFRSDQERIAELEAELAEARKWANTMEHERDWERDVVQGELRCVVDAAREYVGAVSRKEWGRQGEAWRRLTAALESLDREKP